MAGISITLTPVQARILYNTIDGASDAGACEDGNTPQEAEALEEISGKLLRHYSKWKGVHLEPEATPAPSDAPSATEADHG